MRGYFNPLAPRGARLRHKIRPYIVRRISIHSPLAGRDAFDSSAVTASNQFQSTRPSRGETMSFFIVFFLLSHFNPLAPRGARRGEGREILPEEDFNPLAPRGARRA